VSQPDDPREYLFSLEQFGIKLGLDQIRGLVRALGQPDQSFQSIIVAGTNGKGSVTAMLERALRAAGYRTGRYISPHLVRLEERFVVNGVEATPAEVDLSIARMRIAAKTLPAPPSFFEATTAVAFDLFRERGVEVAVLEVGLGGRLDATNVVTPIGAVITAIDFDHQQYLGHTLEAIAGEKAGVIKAGRPVAVARNPDRAREVVAHVAAEVGAPLTYAPTGVDVTSSLHEGFTIATFVTPTHHYPSVRLALRGRHQVDNAMTMIRALEVLHAHTGLRVGPDEIRIGLEQAEWPARLELVRWRGLEVLVDGAHNPAGAASLVAYLQEAYARPLPLVVGAMRDKAIDELIATLAPAASRFVFTTVESPRAAPASDLVTVAARVAPGVPSCASASPMDALATASEGATVVVVAGSLYLCGEIRARIS
jgi:dihydrofolate synthase/folylpolyglutamate synthase